MTTYYPRLTQLLTLGLHLRDTQSGPKLREFLERVCVYPFITKKFRRISTSAEYIRKFIEACEMPKILCWSTAIFRGLLKQDFALLSRSIIIHFRYFGYLRANGSTVIFERRLKSSRKNGSEAWPRSGLIGSNEDTITWNSTTLTLTRCSLCVTLPLVIPHAGGAQCQQESALQK